VQDIETARAWACRTRTAIWLDEFEVHSKERVKDVVYLNQVDIKHPDWANMLSCLRASMKMSCFREKGRVASAVVSVMRKVFSDDEQCHRWKAHQRNTIHTA